jgi:Flp pilus assembly protein TadD
MSLLMDALKKAEQEKKAAAKKRDILNDSGIHLQQTGDHNTDPNEPAESAPAEQAPTTVTPEAGADISSPDISLEPFDGAPSQAYDEISELEEYAPKIEAEVDPPGLEVASDDTQDIDQAADTGGSASTVLNHTDKLEAPRISPEPVTEVDMDQTFHGVELDKTFDSELLEATVQGEPFKPEEFQKSFDETLPGVPAAQLARDIGSQDQPTPVAAQTIFTATSTPAKPSSGFRWLLIGLAFLAVGSALVFYYFSVTPVQRDIPSPIVARGVETIISSSAVENVLPPAGAPPVPISSVETLAGPSISGPVTEVPVGTDIVTAGTPVVDGIGQGLDEQPSEGQTTDGQAPPQISDTADESRSELTPQAGLPEVIEPPSSLIKISRRQRPAGNNQLIQEAFTAFQAGDYGLAETKYRQAQQQLPNNRDVMLGLAAIAGRQGNTSEALTIYIQLLRQNPLDNMARAAVLGYQYGNNLTESVSMIKTMLFDAPDQPILHFTLGKLYAARTNWSEAQKAFFDAYRLDSSNPDYALNLAVSLDRLGQQQTALDYYSVAVELASNSPAGFNTAQVQERINTLNTGN